MDDEPMWVVDRVVALTPGSTITIPKTANEFAIKGNHLTLVKGNQFDGRTKIDPHKHIHKFLGIYDIFKYRDTENEDVLLMMFPLSLTGEAKTWLDELNEGTIETWDELLLGTRKVLVTSNINPYGRMILAFVKKGPLVWPIITVDGVARPKEYTELTPAETIQANCDIKAINIILQGLPTEIYALVSQHRVAKDIWDKIKLLMQGTSLTKQERESQAHGQILNEEELDFLADPDIPEGQSTQTVVTHMTLIVTNSTLPKLLSWRIYLIMVQMLLLRD
ncbi:hypothetical protein Tco_1307787 [Tanacetum coccineum]